MLFIFFLFSLTNLSFTWHFSVAIVIGNTELALSWTTIFSQTFSLNVNYLCMPHIYPQSFSSNASPVRHSFISVLTVYFCTANICMSPVVKRWNEICWFYVKLWEFNEIWILKEFACVCVKHGCTKYNFFNILLVLDKSSIEQKVL